MVFSLEFWKFDKQFCEFKGLPADKVLEAASIGCLRQFNNQQVPSASLSCVDTSYSGVLSALVDAIPPSTPAGSAADTLRGQLALLWSVSWRCGQDSCGPTGQDENHLPRQV